MEEKCTGNHLAHMCDMETKDNFDEIRQLANSPEYICKKCGRIANVDTNLCMPLDLDEALPRLNLE